METSLKNIMLSLQEELTCALCRDIYVQPKALIPCLHTFCSECIYGLEAVDPLRCPICRSTSFNTLNNFTVQSFLDIFEKSKLTVESLSSCSISSSSSSYISVPHSPASSSSTAITCRSCPCNSNELNYVCSEGDRHIRCSFCSDYMPARNFKKDGPALDQCCNFCGIIACDAYWGCRNTDKESKLYILSEARDIESLVLDISSIDHIENGHLNKSEISLLNQFIRRGCLTWTEAWKHCLVDFDDNNYRTSRAQKMVPLAHQIYNTRQIPVEEIRTDDDGQSSEEECYYDRISEEGILPSEYLRTCYTCLVTIVNGQFYGYWKEAISNKLALDMRDKCREGISCEEQWRREPHATRLSHIAEGNWYES